MTVTALILAAQRDGKVDPLAAEMGVSHKCIVPVAGRPMIVHVVETLAASPSVGEIRVSIDNFNVIARLPEIARLIAAGRLTMMQARDNLVDSVVDAVAGADFPLFITTADNVLLTPEAVESMQATASRGADVAVAFTRRDSVLAAHPDGQRRFYKFSDDAYSNCNSYWIGNARALSATEVFRGGGQFAKHPARIVKAFGLINLIRFRYGIGTLAAAFDRFSRRFGLVIRPVIFTDGAIAIDVDNSRTHAIAEGLLVARAPAIAAE